MTSVVKIFCPINMQIIFITFYKERLHPYFLNMLPSFRMSALKGAVQSDLLFNLTCLIYTLKSKLL